MRNTVPRANGRCAALSRTPENERGISFCTDDRQPKDLLEEGSIDHLVRTAIACGVAPVGGGLVAADGEKRGPCVAALADRGPLVGRAGRSGARAAIGLAIGAIGSMLAAVLSGILKLPWWQFPIVIAAIILVISLPSVLLAWLKLRKRNIGPILDANGWAVNARARINIPFGTSLTAAAVEAW